MTKVTVIFASGTEPTHIVLGRGAMSMNSQLTGAGIPNTPSATVMSLMSAGLINMSKFPFSSVTIANFGGD